MLPCFCTPDPAPLGPRAGRARNSMHATAKCSRARSYSTGRGAGKWLPDHDLMDRGWISLLYGVSLRRSEVRISNPHRTTTTRQGQQGHPMKSEEGQESRPGGDARPCHLAASSEEKEAEGSWFTHTHADGRPKKERKRKENKNIKRKRGKKRIKNKSKEKERKKEPEKMHPLKYRRSQRGLIRD